MLASEEPCLRLRASLARIFVSRIFSAQLITPSLSAGDAMFFFQTEPVFLSCPLVFFSSHHLFLLSPSPFVLMSPCRPMLLSPCPLVLLSTCPLVLQSSCSLILFSYCPFVIGASCPPFFLSSCPPVQRKKSLNFLAPLLQPSVFLSSCFPASFSPQTSPRTGTNARTGAPMTGTTGSRRVRAAMSRTFVFRPLELGPVFLIS